MVARSFMDWSLVVIDREALRGLTRCAGHNPNRCWHALWCVVLKGVTFLRGGVGTRRLHLVLHVAPHTWCNIGGVRDYYVWVQLLASYMNGHTR